MIESLTGLISSVRQNALYIWLAIAIGFGIVVFSSEEIATGLGVDEYRVIHRGEFGFVFILSISISAFLFLREIVALLKKRVKKRSARKGRIARLKTLTPAEKDYLRPYIIKEKTTQSFDPDDGVVISLLGKGLIYTNVRDYDIFIGAPFNLEPWVRDHLARNRDLLSGSPTARISK